TPSNGSYSFGNLTPGTYTLTVTAPSGYEVNGTSNTASGTLAPLYSGNTTTQNVPVYPTSATGSESVQVFQDSNGDETDDACDPGLAGVSVTLVNGSHTYGPQTTNSSGTATFTGLPAGTYTVDFSAPSGYVMESATSTATTPGANSSVVVGAYQPNTITG